METHHTWDESCSLGIAPPSSMASIIPGIPEVQGYPNKIEAQECKRRGESPKWVTWGTSTWSREPG